MKAIDYRGKLRLLILDAVSRGYCHGYGIMKYLEDLIGYSPGAGAIYPQLKYLHARGFIRVEPRIEGGRMIKAYALTEKGMKYLSERHEELREIHNLLKGFRELLEIGWGDVMQRIKEIVKLMPNIRPELKERVRKAVREFTTELDSVLSEVERSERLDSG
jgi:DNA-binding PadR family transcriptional regulator